MLMWHRYKGARAVRRGLTPSDTPLDPFESVPLLSGLSRRDTAILRRVMDPVRFPGGTVVAREDDPKPQLLVITDGHAVATTAQRRPALLGPGDHFGELTLLLRQPVGETVRTLTPVQALVLSRRHFWGAIHAAPAFAARLLARLAQRLAEGERERLVAASGSFEASRRHEAALPWGP